MVFLQIFAEEPPETLKQPQVCFIVFTF